MAKSKSLVFLLFKASLTAPPTNFIFFSPKILNNFNTRLFFSKKVQTLFFISQPQPYLV